MESGVGRISGNCMTTSAKIELDRGNYIRPVVHLNSKVKINTCLGENSSTNMHTIKQK